MAWVLLLIAGLLEVGFTTSLRYTDNFTKFWPTAIFIVLATLSFSLLAKAAETIPLGTSYAVWTGIGAAGTVIVGIFYFGEPASALRLLFLVTLIGAIIGLKLVS
jgi:quaternary ammonium compound-resistance protein SugE